MKRCLVAIFLLVSSLGGVVAGPLVPSLPFDPAWVGPVPAASATGKAEPAAKAPGGAGAGAMTATATSRAGGAAGAAPAVDAPGVIGAGDVLQVTVFGQPDMSAEVSVTDSGEVTLPLIGQLNLKGMSPQGVEKLIAERLRAGQYLLNPDVSVSLKQLRSQMVSVLGEVQRPGRYPLQGRVTVLDLLATAGGLTPRADSVVYLLRKSPGAGEQSERVRIPVRLDKLAEMDRGPLDLALGNDDVVFVGPQKFFYIYGEVRRPGSYPMEPDLDIMRALSIGGGVTERGSTSRINLHRKTDQAGGQDLSPGLTDAVHEGDVIFVKERLF